MSGLRNARLCHALGAALWNLGRTGRDWEGQDLRGQSILNNWADAFRAVRRVLAARLAERA